MTWVRWLGPCYDLRVVVAWFLTWITLTEGLNNLILDWKGFFVDLDMKVWNLEVLKTLTWQFKDILKKIEISLKRLWRFKDDLKSFEFPLKSSFARMYLDCLLKYDVNRLLNCALKFGMSLIYGASYLGVVYDSLGILFLIKVNI